jgi:CheY-like chemotaxis protein
MQMPDMNGIELGAEIRKLRTREDLPMILLHSSAPSLKELSANETVFGAVASKPVRRSQLLELVSTSLSQSKTTIRSKKSVHRLDPDLANRVPLKILVAEDTPINRELFITILNRMGYKADCAENGVEVLKALEGSEYDVIFMDVHMPEMDGLEATRRIRALNNQLARRPRIIAMTAAALVEDRQKCLEAGMDDYLSKPIRLQEIEAAIERTGAAKAALKLTDFN